mmetsp:Transcript_33200/g.75835  ORF Transcript_33200/g.75835 Transcript_33200/m.75835 type:complete len:228 (+) Transcript_33200:937-1620(+)
MGELPVRRVRSRRRPGRRAVPPGEQERPRPRPGPRRGGVPRPVPRGVGRVRLVRRRVRRRGASRRGRPAVERAPGADPRRPVRGRPGAEGAGPEHERDRGGAQHGGRGAGGAGGAEAEQQQHERNDTLRIDIKTRQTREPQPRRQRLHGGRHGVLRGHRVDGRQALHGRLRVLVPEELAGRAGRRRARGRGRGLPVLHAVHEVVNLGVLLVSSFLLPVVGGGVDCTR